MVILLAFLAVGEFKKQVGEVVTYTKNEEHQTGKLIYEQQAPMQKNYPKDDVQKYIIRQSSLNRATDLFSIGGNWDEQQIIETARIFENYVYNG